MEDLRDLFVPYKIALRLKKKGFNEPCLASFKNKKLQLILIDGKTQAPTYQQAVNWLREVHKKQIRVNAIAHNGKMYWRYEFQRLDLDSLGHWLQSGLMYHVPSKQMSETYDGALLKAIEEALKII